MKRKDVEKTLKENQLRVTTPRCSCCDSRRWPWLRDTAAFAKRPSRSPLDQKSPGGTYWKATFGNLSLITHFHVMFNAFSMHFQCIFMSFSWDLRHFFTLNLLEGLLRDPPRVVGLGHGDLRLKQVERNGSGIGRDDVHQKHDAPQKGGKSGFRPAWAQSSQLGTSLGRLLSSKVS